ncbi:hypothetical protein E5988_16040 [Sphingomonas olei]|uniref:MobA/MobL protein domain-containing protein n=1 Tax=Sphingomonas olei TaxID=1886787 RepID=A0ABY2QE71_9SPHN|nr:hypothetical protein E5988_16040 [Sphingomonas olei]
MQKRGERNVLAKAKTDRRGAGGRRAGRPAGSALLADGAPATARASDTDYAAFVRQRKDDRARAIRAARERAARTAEAIADARIRRAFLQEEAAREREIEDFWRRFFRRPPPERDGIARHDGRKRNPGQAQSGGGLDRGTPSRRARGAGAGSARSGALPLASYSGPVLDRRGRRGVYLSATYLGSKRASPGCARRLVRYVTDPLHVEHLADGTALTGSNVGATRTETSAAFSVVEDLNRAARANAKIVFHLIVQLPHDVTPAERAEILAEWCEEAFGQRNLPYVWAVHAPDPDGDPRNTHGHVAVSFRPLVRTAPFAWNAGRELKAELDNPEAFRTLRERFAETMTRVCDRAGKNRTYTALSYAARGMKLKPTTHLGPHKTRLVRQGRYVAAHARNARTIRQGEALLALDRFDQRRKVLEARLERASGIAARSVTRTRPAVRPIVNAMPVTRAAPARECAAAFVPVALTAVRQTGHIDTPRRTVYLPMPAVAMPQPLLTSTGVTRVVERQPVAATPPPFLATSTLVARDDDPLAGAMPSEVRLAARPAVSPDRVGSVRTASRPDRRTSPGTVARLDQIHRLEPEPASVLRALRSVRPRATSAGRDAAPPALTLPSIAARPSTAATDAVTLDAEAAARRRERIAHAKARLRAAERRRAEEQAAPAAAAPALPETSAIPIRRRPVRTRRPGVADWSDGIAFEAVPPADQPDSFASITGFDTVGALRPAQRNSVPAPRHSSIAEPDGFGGTRTTPALVYQPVPVHVRLAAYDTTGAPSRALLALLHHAGHHPGTLAFASDGRLMPLPGTPEAIAPLLHLWRHDDAVEALVVTTVTASRAAGRPIWPEALAARVRALDPPRAAARDRPRDMDRGPTR